MNYKSVSPMSEWSCQDDQIETLPNGVFNIPREISINGTWNSEFPETNEADDEEDIDLDTESE